MQATRERAAFVQLPLQPPTVNLLHGSRPSPTSPLQINPRSPHLASARLPGPEIPEIPDMASGSLPPGSTLFSAVSVFHFWPVDQLLRHLIFVALGEENSLRSQ